MKNFKINEEESKQILNLHSEMKKKVLFLNEQVQDAKAKLQQYMDDGCLSLGEATDLKDTKGNNIPAVKIKSKKVPGRIYFVFSDLSYGYYDANGKFVYEKNKLYCPSPHTNRQEIEKLKTEENWMERHETNASDLDLANNQKWETHKVGNVILYRRKGDITVAAGTTDQNQKDILAGLRAIGWRTSDEVPANKRVNPTKASTIRSDWFTYFRDDLDLYPDPNAKARQNNPTVGNEDSARKFTESLNLLTISDCKKDIEEFFNLYAYDVPGQDPFLLETKNQTIRYCARRFDFDKIIYAKTRKRLFVLAGYNNDQGTGTPSDSPFRIKLPPSYKP